MKKFVAISEKLIALFARLSAYLVIILSFLVVYDALNRYIFHGGSVALQEWEWHLFDIIFLLGLSYTLQTDKHVRVDIFYTSYQPKTKALVNILSQLFLVIPFSMLIIMMSYNFVDQSYIQHEISSDPGGLTYRYLIKSMIIVGFGLLVLQSICILYHNIITFRKQS